MLERIYSAAIAETWAIDQTWLTRAITHAEEAGPTSTRLPKVDGAVAILPMHGVISQRASIWQELFGGTATESFGAAFVRAMNDERIKAVVFDVDSPGGTTAGVKELSDLIAEGASRQIKPVVAIADAQMASAAYWLASQVGPKRLSAAPSADVGSIGVFRMHEDLSEAMAKQGVKVELLAMPDYKTEANPYEPLSEDARTHHMGQVAASYEMFVKDVARGRGVTAGVVKDGYGKGRTFHAEQAQEMGMVDRIESLPKLLARLGAGSGGRASVAAEQLIADELCQAWESGIVVPFVEQPRLCVFELQRRRKIALTNNR